MNDDQVLYGSGAAAKSLGIPRWRLIQLIEHGQLPDAALQVSGRRAFTAEEIKVLAKLLKARKSGSASEHPAAELVA